MCGGASLTVLHAQLEFAAREIAKQTVETSPHIKHFRRKLSADELTVAMLSLSIKQSERRTEIEEE